MKKLISAWSRKLINIEDNLEIHRKASVNNDYTVDMRDYARSRVITLTENKKLIEGTIEALKERDI